MFTTAEAFLSQPHGLYIDGAFVAPILGKTFPVTNPATEAVIFNCPSGTDADVESAVRSARASWEKGAWRHADGKTRATALTQIGDWLEQHKAEIAKLETLNNGKSLTDSTMDIQECADVFRYYAKLATELVGKREEIAVCDDSYITTVSKVPIGVVALITPFNYPLLMATWKVAPALAAGCSVVLKPSEITPLTCIALAMAVHHSALPKGVFNLLLGDGPTCGAPLSRHPLVDKFAFTGSCATGNTIYKEAAKELKNCSLELGGKSAAIVFDDADLEATVEWLMFGIFNIGGQICSATSRALVQKGIYDRLVKRLVECSKAIPVGNGLDEGVLLGPLVNKNQYEKVLNYIGRAKQEGCELLCGGARPAHLTKGYFVEPTIFKVNAEATIWKEEIFGPVLSIMPFTTEEEAVALANSSIFGLAGAVMSADLTRCNRVAEALEVGVAWINCSQPAFREAPWGGIKKSGLQGRDLGPWGMDTFLCVKQTTQAKDPKKLVGFYTLPQAKM